jgi:hypothetical protein
MWQSTLRLPYVAFVSVLLLSTAILRGTASAPGTSTHVVASRAGAQFGQTVTHHADPADEDQKSKDPCRKASLAWGDFDGDQFGDLAVGVPGFNLQAGAVAIFYGTSNGFAVNNLSQRRQLWTQDSTGIVDIAEAGDRFGATLAGGEFGLSGQASDLATPLSNAGAVHVIYYQSFGVGLSAAAGPGDQVWTQDSAEIIDAAEAGERFGSALSAWDFGQGFLADLAVGVPFQSVAGLPGAGALHVIYGDNTSFIPALRAFGNQFWTQDSFGIEGVAEAGDQFGRTAY